MDLGVFLGRTIHSLVACVFPAWIFTWQYPRDDLQRTRCEIDERTWGITPICTLLHTLVLHDLRTRPPVIVFEIRWRVCLSNVIYARPIRYPKISHKTKRPEVIDPIL